MRYVLTVVLLLALATVALAAETAGTQERHEITVLIPLKYLSADVAVRIFGGWVVPTGTWVGQRDHSAYGSYRSGSYIGGGRGHRPNYGYRGSNGPDYGVYGQGYQGRIETNTSPDAIY